MSNKQNINSYKDDNKIGLFSATIICINAMIGVGIFATPAKLATTVGPAGIITYLFVIAAVFFMALSIARVAQYYPQAGSFYTYAKQWGGHNIGIIAAGSYIIGVIIGLGLITQIAAEYFHTALPYLSSNTYGIVIVAAITLLNVMGVKVVQTGQIALLGCTLFALISTMILGFSNASFNNLFPFMPYGYFSLAKATSAAIFAFFGFESAASLFHIVKQPEKNIPKALLLSLLVVGTLYITFIGAIILAIPAKAFASQDTTLPEVLISYFPKYAWIAKLIGIAILTALLGVLQSMIYSVSMLTQSFLKLLNNKTAQNIANNKSGFKNIVYALGLFILLNFFLLKNKSIFFNLTALFIISAFGLSIMTLIVKRHNKTFWQTITTYLGLITAFLIFISAAISLTTEIL